MTAVVTAGVSPAASCRNLTPATLDVAISACELSTVYTYGDDDSKELLGGGVVVVVTDADL